MTSISLPPKTPHDTMRDHPPNNHEWFVLDLVQTGKQVYELRIYVYMHIPLTLHGI
jgi:hypothetical protein